MKTARCRGCGAEIVWIRMPSGKSMPCDAEPRYFIERPKTGSKKIVTANGEAFFCEYTDDPNAATGVGYVPHWGTCPAAGEFRTPKANS